MPVASQARILDLGATETRGRILHDRRLGIEPTEETLTQNFVSAYVARVRRAGLSAQMREFTRLEESTLTGADIALWFNDARGNFAGIYLQAKRLFADGSYRGLNHGHNHQYETLVDGARRDGVLAGYAFYNGLEEPEPRRAACGHGVGATDISGIAIASAASLRPHLAGRVPRSRIEQLCSPISCLVRHTVPPGSGGTSSGGTGSGSGGDDRGGGSGDGTLPPDGPTGLPFALLQFAEQWPGSDVFARSGDQVPAYVRETMQSPDMDPGLPEEAFPFDYPRWWGFPGPGDRVYDRGDLTFTTSVLIVGPK